MTTTIPVDFEELAKRPPGRSAGDYPWSISASDLMRNFVFATMDVDDALVESTTGQGGHEQRRLKIKPGVNIGDIMVWSGSEWQPLAAAPAGGVSVLASQGGMPYWLGTEGC